MRRSVAEQSDSDSDTVALSVVGRMNNEVWPGVSKLGADPMLDMG